MPCVFMQKNIFIYLILSLIFATNSLCGKKTIDTGISGVLLPNKPSDLDNKSIKKKSPITVEVTQTTHAPIVTYDVSSLSPFISSQSTKAGSEKPSQTHNQKLSNITFAQWHELLKTTNPLTALHAYSLCALPAYRTALKSLIPPTFFKTHMREIFKKMHSNSEFETALTALGKDVRDFYYNEGKQAYIAHETARAEQAFEASHLSRSIEQSQALVTSTQQHSSDVNALVSHYQTHAATSLQLRDAALQNSNAHKLNQFMQLVHTELAALGNGQDAITFVDYYAPLKDVKNSARLTALDKLGLAKNDFLCVGNALVQHVHEAILNDMLPKIADAAVKVEQNADALSSLLKQTIQSVHAALECNKQGDRAGMYQHYAQANHTMRYITLVQEGHRSFDRSFTSEYKNTCHYEVDPYFIDSPCREACPATCPLQEQHCQLRQNNGHARRSQEFEQAITTFAQGNVVIATQRYDVSSTLATALQENNIPLATIQQCTGTQVDQVLHRQAVDFMHAALKSVEDFRQPLINASYDAITAVQHGNLKQAYYCLQLCGTMSDMAAISSNIPTGMFAPEQSMLEVAAYKALSMIRSIPECAQGVSVGAKKSANEAAHTLAHPRTWPEKVSDAVGGLGTLITKTKNSIKDQITTSAAMFAPGLFASETLIAAENRKLIRYEKALALLEYGLDVASKMTPQQWGELGGRMAVDTVTGKITSAGASKILSASKNIVAAIKKSEAITRAGSKLSAKARRIRERVKEMEATFKTMTSKNPQAIVTGVPAKTGLILRETEQAGAQGGKKAVGASQSTVELKNKLQWTPHDGKHIPKKNMTWKEVVESTKQGGKAKYKWRDVRKIEEIERKAWQHGIPTNDGKPHKVMQFNEVIGANNGQETKYILIESTNNGNTIHGHPITKEEYISKIKKI